MRIKNIFNYFFIVLVVIFIFSLTFNSLIFCGFQDSISNNSEDSRLVTYKILYNSNSIELINNLSKEEFLHLNDVNKLIKISLIVLFILLIISSIIFLYKDLFFLKNVGIFGSIISSLLLLSTIFFDKLFILFHEVLFRNDYWILPGDSFLIQTYPIKFFIIFYIGFILFNLSLFFIIYLFSDLYLKIKIEESEVLKNGI